MGFERICRRLMEYGVLAPSIYNSQPWKFSLDEQQGIIEVSENLLRARPREIDEAQRDLYLALGSCIENMILAAPALGYEIELLLFSRQDVAATLKLKPMVETMPENLFPSLLLRQTHAGKYKENSVQELHLERLRNVSAFSPREKLYFLNRKETLKQLEIFLHDLSHEGSKNTELVEEISGWIRPSSIAPDGLPIDHLGLPCSVKTRFAFLRYFLYQKEIKEVSRQTLLRQGHGIEAPTFFLITTRKPGKESYLSAGRWFGRLTLTLSEIELGAQAIHLPITLKAAHRSLLELFKAGLDEEPLLLVRLGQPIEKKWPRTFRRPLSECLTRT